MRNPSQLSMDSTDSDSKMAQLDDLVRRICLSKDEAVARYGGASIHSTSSKESSQMSYEHPTVIILDIGGRKFKTETATLCADSGLFRHQLSDLYQWTPQADGSYFLDADPEIFEHVLRFMRRPSVFPLFYDAVRGFDYGLYSRLQAEADYFQVDSLRDWIREKKYQLAVMVKTDTPVVSELAQLTQETNASNIAYERHVVSLIVVTDV
jgi:hypothetical protein